MDFLPISGYRIHVVGEDPENLAKKKNFRGPKPVENAPGPLSVRMCSTVFASHKGGSRADGVRPELRLLVRGGGHTPGLGGPGQAAVRASFPSTQCKVSRTDVNTLAQPNFNR